MQNNIECKFYADVGTTIGSTQILDNYQKKEQTYIPGSSRLFKLRNYAKPKVCLTCENEYTVQTRSN